MKCGHFRIIENCANCLELQSKWYGKLKKKGFDDIEDSNLRILKKWTGITDIIDSGQVQDPEAQIQSTWPDIKLKTETHMYNDASFESICRFIAKHGNNSLSPKQMMRVWEDHCSGASSREIAKRYDISAFSGWYIVKRLKEGLRLMVQEEPKKIVIRLYDPKTDAPLLFASWRKSIWHDTHTENEINPMQFRLMTKKINVTLRNPHVQVKIACLSDDLNEIKGYSVMCDSTLEFVYVKLDYRNQGIATLLTKGFTDIIDPETKIGKAIALKKNLITKEKHYGQSTNREEKARA